MAIPKKFWKQEAAESEHKTIKGALLKAAGHKMKKGVHQARIRSKIKSEEGKAKIHKVMKEYAAGDLASGSKKGPKVKDKKQALAIAYKEARRGKKK